MVLLRRLLGDALRRTRQRQRRTLREVSTAARVSLGYLSEVERGQKEPSSELLAAICGALDVELSDVLREISVTLDAEQAAAGAAAALPASDGAVAGAAAASGAAPGADAEPVPAASAMAPVASVASVASPAGRAVAVAPAKRVVVEPVIIERSDLPVDDGDAVPVFDPVASAVAPALAGTGAVRHVTGGRAPVTVAA